MLKFDATLDMHENYLRYLKMDWTSGDDDCEAGCGRMLSPNSYYEGELGHYCSKKCCENSED